MLASLPKLYTVVLRLLTDEIINKLNNVHLSKQKCPSDNKLQ